MEALLGYFAYELLGTVILAVMVYLSLYKKKPKPVQPSKLDQIARETARLEAENKRLELEYATLRDEELEALDAPARPLSAPRKSSHVPADCRATRVKAEFAYYQSKSELPPNSLLDSRTLDELTSYYESSIAKAFNTVPLILTNGTRIEFRKLS